MKDLAIKARAIGKRYVIGKAPRAKTLRDAVAGGFSARAASQAEREFWALRDVSFELRRGEALGVIGKNGAGKSTLLKILSRICEPTSGRVEMRGRVASLLEVGTGFHPELTGRENVYLNGAILGMSQREIAARFDEIVAFAETEQFVDTPVKHYSSGMHMRLAFAVAAHLDPDVLILDEVLAVGDTAFQTKCAAVMQRFAGEGRSILLVSHGLQAIRNLCSRALVLVAGAVDFEGSADEAIERYLGTKQRSLPEDIDTRELPRPRFIDADAPARITRVRILTPRGGASAESGGLFEIELTIRVVRHCREIMIGWGVASYEVYVFETRTLDKYPPIASLDPGLYRIRAGFEQLPLAAGLYTLNVGMRDAERTLDYLPGVGTFHMTRTSNPDPTWHDPRNGVVELHAQWGRLEPVVE